MKRSSRRAPLGSFVTILYGGCILGFATAIGSSSDELKKVRNRAQLDAQSMGSHSEIESSLLLRRHSWEGGVDAALTEDSFETFWRSSLSSWNSLRQRKPWLIAVCSSVLSSFLCVCGFMLQKVGVSRSFDSKSYYTIGSIVLSPCWIAGFFLLVFANAFGDYEAYSLAPLSLTAPLSGVTVVLNLILVPICLGEKIQVFPDLFATALIFMGGALTTAFGTHQDENLSSDSIGTLVRRPVNIALYLALLLLLAGLSKLDAPLAESHSGRASDACRLPRVGGIAMTAAVAGCLLNLHLKATAELVKSGSSWWGVGLSLLLCGPYSLLQMNYISRGLRFYLQTVFVPVYNSLLMVGVTFCGSVFYSEGKSMEATARRYFIMGLILSLVGLWNLTLRSPQRGIVGKTLTTATRSSQASIDFQKHDMT